jgi:predicted nucleic acid-binding protein
VTAKIVLDTGVLGQLTHPRANPELTAWFSGLLASGAQFFVPEIADYELRRELVRSGKTKSIDRLDQFEAVDPSRFLVITTSAMRRAADLWAKTRNEGFPMADDAALDADVILAAQTEAIARREGQVIVATDNVGHLGRLVDARRWEQIAIA